MSQHGCPERLSNRSKGFQEDGPSQPTMEVLVETLTGTAFEMTVSPSDTIFAIKSKIFRVEGIPVSQQHLLYNLKELDNASSLHEHSISDGARLRLVLGMCGGPITTRRLPPPPNAEPWRDIERLLDTNSREESEWGSAGNGCKVTVLVFREGERVNMLRVRENRDGTYSPLDHNKYSSSLTHLLEQEPDDGLSGSLHENAVTMGKMLDLRRRMENLSVQRRRPAARTDKAEIQKTRSEETLSVPCVAPGGYGDAFAPFAYALDYDCATDRLALLPAIGTRADSERSVRDAVRDDSERLNGLAGGILVGALPRLDAPPGARAPVSTAEYGPLVGGEAGGWRAAGFGSVGSVGSVGAVGSLATRGTPPLAHSASSLHVRPPRHHAPLSSSTSDLEQLKRNRVLPALARHRPREHLHLGDERPPRRLRRDPPAAPAAPPAPPAREETPEPIREPSLTPSSSVTVLANGGGDKEATTAISEGSSSSESKDNKDESKDDSKDDSKDSKECKEGKEGKERKARLRCGLCSKRLSIATVHRCRCGAQFCAPHRYAEVHGCLYDYKAHAHAYLQRANPLVSAPKLPKI